MVALLLRKLLLDENPLVDQVNRQKRHKIRFIINDYPLPSPEPGLEFCSVEDALDPSVIPCPRPIEVTRDELFSRPVIVYGNHTVTVRDLILHAAVVGGAVHAGTAKSDKDKALKQMTELIGVGGLPAGFRLLRVIGKIVRNGLEPLRMDPEQPS